MTLQILICCNWTSPSNLIQLWNKMTRHQDYTWGNLHFCTEHTPPNKIDYWVIINTPGYYTHYDPQRTLVFQMEPYMERHQQWGEWSCPDPNKFLKVFIHRTHLNLLEWHLSKTYSELDNTPIPKQYTNEISAIMSCKYTDPGHKFRINFINYAEHTLKIHVFGSNAFQYKNYKGSLPYHQKDDGLFPYRYTFAVENNCIENYITEKLIDAILSECLCFYYGAPNVSHHINLNAYIQLDSSMTYQECLFKIQDTIETHQWEKRLDVIQSEKKRILNTLQLFPTLFEIINKIELK